MEQGSGRSASRWIRRHGASGRAVEPRRLRQAVDEVERLDALAGGALDEVVDHADREDPPGPLVDPHVDADVLLPRTCFVAGGAATTLTNGSSA